MGKALTKEQQEKLAQMSAPAPKREVKPFENTGVSNISFNNRKGQFSHYKDDEAKLIGDSISVRPLLIADKYMRQVKDGASWKVDAESVMRLEGNMMPPISNDGLISCGRKLGKEAKGMDPAEFEINKAKATYYATLYAIYEGDVVAIKLPSGKGSAMKEFMRNVEGIPVSTEITLAVIDDRMVINTKKVDLKVTTDELEAVERAQEAIDQYNFFIVLGHNRSQDRTTPPVNLEDYVTEDFMEKYELPKSENKPTGEVTNESYEDDGELDDNIPF